MRSDGIRTTLLTAACLLVPANCLAQYTGDNIKGDLGLHAGTQPPPGWHVSLLYTRYATETARDRSGGDIETFSDVDEATIQGVIGRFWWVSDRKLLGASYGVLIAPSLVDNAMELPAEGLDDETGFGLGDLYFQPINLGWHWSRADVTAGAGLYVPTGLYEPEADDNTGLGMTAADLFAGSTFYLDPARRWSLAATASWETHREKKHSPLRIGDLLTLEGGCGVDLFEGTVSAGIAYYAQWKITEDDQLDEINVPLSRHKVYAAGPEVTLPIEWKDRRILSLGFRGLLEFGADSTTEGATFVFTITVPRDSGR